MVARKRLPEDVRQALATERLFMPPGELRTRCGQCGKDCSVQWIICCLSQCYAEEKCMVWDYLRKDQPLLDFRAMRKRKRGKTRKR